jgi:hypothetical protein
MANALAKTSHTEKKLPAKYWSLRTGFYSPLWITHMQQSKISVEKVGDLIVARIQGALTDAIFQERHDRVLSALGARREGKVLFYDVEREPPSADLVLFQQRLDTQLSSIRLRRAVVVSDTKTAYLARVTFTRGTDRVFYDDLSAAVRWLGSSYDASSVQSIKWP